jgi:hypothetical protein
MTTLAQHCQFCPAPRVIEVGAEWGGAGLAEKADATVDCLRCTPRVFLRRRYSHRHVRHSQFCMMRSKSVNRSGGVLEVGAERTGAMTPRRRSQRAMSEAKSSTVHAACRESSHRLFQYSQLYVVPSMVTGNGLLMQCLMRRLVVQEAIFGRLSSVVGVGRRGRTRSRDSQ